MPQISSREDMLGSGGFVGVSNAWRTEDLVREYEPRCIFGDGKKTAGEHGIASGCRCDKTPSNALDAGVRLCFSSPCYGV